MTAVTRARRRALLGRALAAVLVPAIGVPVALTGPVGAAPRPQQVKAPETQDEARRQVAEAQEALEHSSTQVQQAGKALAEVAATLPGAQRDVSRARGELAGARAKAAAASAAVERAEAARSAAEERVEEATGRVEQSRDEVGALARRAYQRGRLGDVRDVMEATDPQDALARAELVRRVFRFRNHSLQVLTDDRLALASTKAQLVAEEQQLQRAREQAEAGEQRAREIAVRAEQAAVRVADLVAKRRTALAAAESARSADLEEYRQAQAASEALAERIRAAARAAAAREAARRAAEERRLAEERRRAAAAAAAEAARQRASRTQQSRPQAAAPAPPPPAPAPQAAPERDDTSRMRWPAPGRLTSRYGWRTHPVYGDRRFHAGIDIGGGYGAPVRAASGGTVLYAGPASGYGTLVVVSHGTVGGRNLSTAYAHLSSMSVREGDAVVRGQQVGRIGTVGTSTGPHLHFEVRRDGDPVDPLDYVSPP